MNKTIKFKTKQELPLMGYSSHNSFYASSKWRKLREYKLQIQSLCERCESEDVYKTATDVDHIIPIVQDEGLALDITNLQSLCKSHHSLKTQKDNKRANGRILNQIL